jgi:hypothetical protein
MSVKKKISKRKPLIKLRSKPKAPKRKINRVNYSCFDFDNIQDILDLFPNIKPKDIMIDIDDYDCLFYANMPESEESYKKRMNEYFDKVMRYNDWYIKNDELIIEEMRLRKEEKLKKEKEWKEKQQKKLEKEIKEAQKKLETLK